MGVNKKSVEIPKFKNQDRLVCQQTWTRLRKAEIRLGPLETDRDKRVTSDCGLE